MKRSRWPFIAVAGLLCAGMYEAARAQYTATLPSTCNPQHTSCTTSTPIVNPDGSLVGGVGGGGGGAVTIANGADVAIGSTTDSPYADATGATAATLMGINKGQFVALSGLFKAGQSIGNTAFGISGTLPAFTSTPTFNLGTAPNLTITNTSFNVGNFPVTQPVSGTVNVGNFPASQAVTGAFYQTTQPVSGTFFQATQPVSGTFFQATQPVSNAGTFAVQNSASTPAGTATIGNVLRSTPYNETTTALAASATFTGTARDSGAVGTATTANIFACFVRADQSGTLNQQGSNDSTTWYTELTTAISANTSVTTTGRVFTRYHRCQVVNGTTAETSLFVNSQLGE